MFRMPMLRLPARELSLVVVCSTLLIPLTACSPSHEAQVEKGDAATDQPTDPKTSTPSSTDNGSKSDGQPTPSSAKPDRGAADTGDDTTPSADDPTATVAVAALPIELPKPAFKGTPKHAQSDNLEAPRKGPREPFMAPANCLLLSKGKPVTSSDDFPVIGELYYATDGDKNASEGSWVELGPGSQYLQIDLGKSTPIHAVLIWQFHMNARIYRDIVVRISDDADFIEYETVFNNDHDNSSGLGVGEDQEYWETNEGKLVDAKGTEGRYVRVYSNGNTEDGMNHFTEVEVWGVGG